MQTQRKLWLGLLLTLLAASAAGNELFTVPVRFYIVSDLEMHKRGETMRSWVHTGDVRNTILPEVNRIWAKAGIRFELDAVNEMKSANPPNKAALVAYIENAVRDKNGESDPERIRKLNRLIDFQPQQGVVQIFLIPYLGEASQGNASRKQRRIYVGQWSDKSSKGKKPPRRFRLTEPEPMQDGSLSRTVAHELGHVLGLKHPDKAAQTEFGLLMGGKRAGYRLTEAELAKARKNAERIRSRNN